jgi:mitogen-activated protein kinase 1/3
MSGVYTRKVTKVKSEDFKVDEFYKPSKKLGSGAYGLVAAARDKRTDTKVAIKKVRDCFHNLTDAKRILREIKLMQHLNHPNIIQLVDMINPLSTEDFEDIYLVMEYMQSDLHKIIYSENELSSSHMAFIIYQILCALKHIHSAGVIHRDLKPGNILINADCTAKICDFGLARGVSDEDMLLTEYVVTRWYRAPEVVVSAQRYDESVDIWAVGCILAEMLLKEPVFQGEDYIDQLRVIFKIIGTPSDEDLANVISSDAVNFIKRLKSRERKDLRTVFANASPEAVDLLEKIFVFDPTKRITVDEALRHPFF